VNDYSTGSTPLCRLHLITLPTNLNHSIEPGVQDFPGGFRRVDLVPKTLLTRRIAKDSATDPAVALAILRNWFRAKPALHDAAVNLLQTLGYQVYEPDFEKDSISHNFSGSRPFSS